MYMKASQKMIILRLKPYLIVKPRLSTVSPNKTLFWKDSEQSLQAEVLNDCVDYFEICKCRENNPVL